MAVSPDSTAFHPGYVLLDLRLAGYPA